MVLVDACRRNTSNVKTGFQVPLAPAVNELIDALLKVLANNKPTAYCKEPMVTAKPIIETANACEIKFKTLIFDTFLTEAPGGASRYAFIFRDVNTIAIYWKQDIKVACVPIAVKYKDTRGAV